MYQHSILLTSTGKCVPAAFLKGKCVPAAFLKGPAQCMPLKAHLLNNMYRAPQGACLFGMVCTVNAFEGLFAERHAQLCTVRAFFGDICSVYRAAKVPWLYRYLANESLNNQPVCSSQGTSNVQGIACVRAMCSWS